MSETLFFVLELIGTIAFAAVSYTHLDVYKRQMLGRMPVVSLRMLSWVETSSQVM